MNAALPQANAAGMASGDDALHEPRGPDVERDEAAADRHRARPCRAGRARRRRLDGRIVRVAHRRRAARPRTRRTRSPPSPSSPDPRIASEPRLVVGRRDGDSAPSSQPERPGTRMPATPPAASAATELAGSRSRARPRPPPADEPGPTTVGRARRRRPRAAPSAARPADQATAISRTSGVPTSPTPPSSSDSSAGIESAIAGHGEAADDADRDGDPPPGRRGHDRPRARSRSPRRRAAGRSSAARRGRRASAVGASVGTRGSRSVRPRRRWAWAVARASAAPVAAQATSSAARAISSRSADGPATPSRSNRTAWATRTSPIARRIPAGRGPSAPRRARAGPCPAAIVSAIAESAASPAAAPGTPSPAAPGHRTGPTGAAAPSAARPSATPDARHGPRRRQQRLRRPAERRVLAWPAARAPPDQRRREQRRGDPDAEDRGRRAGDRPGGPRRRAPRPARSARRGLARRHRDDGAGADREDDRDQRQVHVLELATADQGRHGAGRRRVESSSGCVGVGRTPKVSNGQ